MAVLVCIFGQPWSAEIPFGQKYGSSVSIFAYSLSSTLTLTAVVRRYLSIDTFVTDGPRSLTNFATLGSVIVGLKPPT